MPAYGRLLTFLQGCRARLQGKVAVQGCRARLPCKAAGQGCRACNGELLYHFKNLELKIKNLDLGAIWTWEYF
jgi:hypothetical protein